MLQHCNSATSRLLHDKELWTNFLQWRNERSDLAVNTAVRDLESTPRADLARSTLTTTTKTSTDEALVPMWADYVEYQQEELDKARSWADCCDHMLRWVGREIKTLVRDTTDRCVYLNLSELTRVLQRLI